MICQRDITRCKTQVESRKKSASENVVKFAERVRGLDLYMDAKSMTNKMRSKDARSDVKGMEVSFNDVKLDETRAATQEFLKSGSKRSIGDLDHADQAAATYERGGTAK